MDRDRPDAAARRAADLAALRGEVCVLRGMVAVLPAALAQIEQDAPPAASAGFERAVETVTHLARTAVRFEPKEPAGRGPSAGQAPPRRRFDPGA